MTFLMMTKWKISRTRNVIEHTSIEELGNHLENAGIMGDVSTEVSFDSDEE